MDNKEAKWYTLMYETKLALETIGHRLEIIMIMASIALGILIAFSLQ